MLPLNSDVLHKVASPPPPSLPSSAPPSMETPRPVPGQVFPGGGGGGVFGGEANGRGLWRKSGGESEGWGGEGSCNISLEFVLASLNKIIVVHAKLYMIVSWRH